MFLTRPFAAWLPLSVSVLLGVWVWLHLYSGAPCLYDPFKRNFAGIVSHVPSAIVTLYASDEDRFWNPTSTNMNFSWFGRPEVELDSCSVCISLPDLEGVKIKMRHFLEFEAGCTDNLLNTVQTLFEGSERSQSRLWCPAFNWQNCSKMLKMLKGWGVMLTVNMLKVVPYVSCVIQKSQSLQNLPCSALP